MSDYDRLMIPPTHDDDMDRPRKGTVTVTLEYDFDAEGSKQEVTEEQTEKALHKCRSTGYTTRSAKVSFWED